VPEAEAMFDLAADAGERYWRLMELAGRYAYAGREWVCRKVAIDLAGGRVLELVHNHHNFAWREQHGGREVVVHRKGATPAAVGVLGIIPGSMATPAYVVRGKGSAASLESASHGAGRVMSRKQASRTFTWSAVRRELEAAGVTVLSAGPDEAPGVYKDIHQVMAAQRDLVEVIARFEPRLVKMAPAGERPED